MPGAPASGVTLGLTGHEEDSELGLINMRGRIYDADLRRFLTPDPFLGAASEGLGIDRFAYVADDPVNYRDPHGYDYGGGYGGGYSGGHTSVDEYGNETTVSWTFDGSYGLSDGDMADVRSSVGYDTSRQVDLNVSGYGTGVPSVVSSSGGPNASASVPHSNGASGTHSAGGNWLRAYGIEPAGLGALDAAGAAAALDAESTAATVSLSPSTSLGQDVRDAIAGFSAGFVEAWTLDLLPRPTYDSQETTPMMDHWRAGGHIFGGVTQMFVGNKISFGGIAALAGGGTAPVGAGVITVGLAITAAGIYNVTRGVKALSQALDTGPNGGQRPPEHQKIVNERLKRRAARREAKSRAENGQNPSGEGFRDHDNARRGPSGERPKGPNTRHGRQKNMGVDEEHRRGVDSHLRGRQGGQQ